MSGGDTGAGEIAVIFVSRRTGADDAGYAAAADRMEALAATMPGYRGFHAARGGDGLGIAVSWWSDEAAAAAWRDDPEHAAVREGGRDRWYGWYRLDVARVQRSYGWARSAEIGPAEDVPAEDGPVDDGPVDDGLAGEGA